MNALLTHHILHGIYTYVQSSYTKLCYRIYQESLQIKIELQKEQRTPQAMDWIVQQQLKKKKNNIVICERKKKFE